MALSVTWILMNALTRSGLGQTQVILAVLLLIKPEDCHKNTHQLSTFHTGGLICFSSSHIPPITNETIFSAYHSHSFSVCGWPDGKRGEIISPRWRWVYRIPRTPRRTIHRRVWGRDLPQLPFRLRLEYGWWQPLR